MKSFVQLFFFSLLILVIGLMLINPIEKSLTQVEKPTQLDVSQKEMNSLKYLFSGKFEY